MGNLFSNIHCHSNNSSNKYNGNSYDCSIMSSTINSGSDIVKELPILNIEDKTLYVSNNRYFTEDDYMNHGVLFQRLYISIVMEYYTDP